MNTRWNLRLALLCYPLLASSAVSPVAADESQTLPLTIGSPAPTLDIEHWISKPSADRGEVDAFAEGNVYVVEFWATWCIPCVASMPHLAELQAKYANQQVRIISVSQEPLDTVTKFLERKVLGSAEERTYAELTAAYSLTTDPDASVFSAYMEGAGQKAIPTAFVVGKTSQIEWIGHPKDLEQPLAAVLNDSWRRDAFRQQWEAEQKQKAFEDKVKRLVRDGELEQALLQVDDAYAADDLTGRDLKESLKLLNLATVARSGDKEATTAILAQLLAQYQDDPQRLVQFSKQLRSVHASVPIPDQILARTIARLERQIDAATGEAKKSATVSLALLYMTTGDKEKAAETLQPLQDAQRKSGDQP